MTMLSMTETTMWQWTIRMRARECLYISPRYSYHSWITFHYHSFDPGTESTGALGIWRESRVWQIIRPTNVTKQWGNYYRASLHPSTENSPLGPQGCPSKHYLLEEGLDHVKRTWCHWSSCWMGRYVPMVWKVKVPPLFHLAHHI